MGRFVQPSSHERPTRTHRQYVARLLTVLGVRHRLQRTGQPRGEPSRRVVQGRAQGVDVQRVSTTFSPVSSLGRVRRVVVSQRDGIVLEVTR